MEANHMNRTNMNTITKRRALIAIFGILAVALLPTIVLMAAKNT